MYESFVNGVGIVFIEPIPLEKINFPVNCKIISYEGKNVIHLKVHEIDFYFDIEHEIRQSNKLFLSKKEYFLKSILLQDGYNPFEFDELLYLVYVIIKETQYKFQVLTSELWFESGQIDDNQYCYTDLINSGLVSKLNNEARNYFEYGNKKYDLKDYEGAIIDYNKALELHPRYAAVYYQRGFTKMMIEDLHGALTDFSKTIEINPKYPMVHYNSGVIKFKQKDYSGALKNFENAIQNSPEHHESYFNYGSVNYILGNRESAMNAFSKAIELNPNSADSYLRRGMIKYDLSDKSGACQDWKRAEQLGNQEAPEIIKKYC